MKKTEYRMIIDRIKRSTDRPRQVSQITRIVPRIMVEWEISDKEAFAFLDEIARLQAEIGFTAEEQRHIDNACAFQMLEML